MPTNRERNIVLFHGSGDRKCRLGLDVMLVGPANDAYDVVRVTDSSWIPKMKEPFSDPFGAPIEPLGLSKN